MRSQARQSDGSAGREARPSLCAMYGIPYKQNGRCADTNDLIDVSSCCGDVHMLMHLYFPRTLLLPRLSTHALVFLPGMACMPC